VFDPGATRRLGRTDVQLTQLGFGSGGLGELFVRIPEAQARATVEAAWEAGVRYFDTAPYYGYGLAEHRVGGVLRELPRDEFVVSTKIGRLLRAPGRGRPWTRDAWAGGLPFGHVFDYGYDAVVRSFEDSLQRLGLDRVDLLLIHDLDAGTHGVDRVAPHLAELEGGGWRALSALRDEGVVRGIGAGINEAAMIGPLLERFELDLLIVAMPYTLLDTDVLDHELPLCVERGVGIVIGAPYASGILAVGAVPGARYGYEDASPEILARVARIEELCRRHGISLRAASLQFPLAHPAVASVIPGAIAPNEPTENAAALRERVPPAFWEELKASGLLRADAPTPG
jgi:D-threo-aldose 1-dehydrogenase